MTELRRSEATSPRILVVDDDESVRRLMGRLLEPLGGVVDEAGSAEQALERLREVAPDLVVLDVHLPGRSGHAVLDAIRSSAELRLVPVIMVSGEATREERLEAIRAGVTDFVAKPFDAEEFVVRVRWLTQLKAFTDTLEEAHRVIVALARTVDARDPCTAGHSQRVSIYAAMLAEHLGFGADAVAVVRQGSLVHDLGKIAVRDRVLFKPSALDVEEFAEMKRHPVVGRELLEPIKSLARALPIVERHHEKLDGSGYPAGLARDEIDPFVRIVTVADIYDGLTSLRPYRDPYSGDDALAWLEADARRGQLDREVVSAFRASLGKFQHPALAPTA